MATIDDPSRIRRSRDIGAYLGLVPTRHQSGELDYTGGISKCGDRRVRTLLYEAANVMLTRHKGQLKLKDWAFAIAKRSHHPLPGLERDVHANNGRVSQLDGHSHPDEFNIAEDDDKDFEELYRHGLTITDRSTSLIMLNALLKVYKDGVIPSDIGFRRRPKKV